MRIDVESKIAFGVFFASFYYVYKKQIGRAHV